MTLVIGSHAVLLRVLGTRMCVLLASTTLVAQPHLHPGMRHRANDVLREGSRQPGRPGEHEHENGRRGRLALKHGA